VYAVSVSPALCDCTTPIYTWYLSTSFVSWPQIQAAYASRLTFHTGYGATTFIIMSVESGVGIVCGCLPGCKPLMNKLFPHVFGNRSQSSSRRRPSTNMLAGKFARESSSSGAKSEQESYRMQPLRAGDRSVVIAEKRQQPDDKKRLPALPEPSHHGLRPPSRSILAGRRPADAYSELQGNGSDSSIEIFLLQRR
jgi:hypothetical protein